MKNIVVTGGSGKAGSAVIKDLVERGYSVLNVDRAPPRETLCHFLKAELNDMGAAIDALRRAMGTVERRRPFELADAVIHLAGIPAPGLEPDAVTFENNLMTTYNIFSAATLLGLKRIVWASSETVLGLPFTRTKPATAPVTEELPAIPESGYALAKLLVEEMARQMHRWNPGTSFIGLRISNILEKPDYANFPTYWADANLRKWNFWSYVDARDVAQACRLGLEASFTGADHFIIAAADTVMKRPSRALLAEHFPEVTLARDIGEFETLLAIDKARRVLGYAPQHSWRTQV
jgi:nucleoside-diphosphate-sugar epimerase